MCTVVYLRDIKDANDVACAHLERFDKIRPASTLVQVTSMLRPWQRVEIEAYAKPWVLTAADAWTGCVQQDPSGAREGYDRPYAWRDGSPLPSLSR